MRFFFLRPGVAFATIVIVLPFAGNGGCGSNTACFSYTQPQFAANGNSCPAQKDALPNFSDPNCPGPVVAVNGPGDFDGELCCYPVTYDAITPDCTNAGGVGGGSMGVSTGPPGVGGFGPVSVCSVTCNAALFSGPPPCGGVALAAFQALAACIGCSSAGTGGSAASCVSQCEPVCTNPAAGTCLTCLPCLTCLQSDCPTELAACQSN